MTQHFSRHLDQADQFVFFDKTRSDPDVLKGLVPVLEAVSGQCAILSADGAVQMVNSEWVTFGRLNGGGKGEGSTALGVGTNYLAICDQAQGAGGREAAAIAQGLRCVLRGDAEDFECEYPCHSPTEDRWFKCIARRFPAGSLYQGLTLIQHVNVTQHVVWRSEAEAYQTNLDAFLDGTPSGVWLLDHARDRLMLDGKTQTFLFQDGTAEIDLATLLKNADKGSRRPFLDALAKVAAHAIQSAEFTLRLVNEHGEERVYSCFLSLVATGSSSAQMIQVLYIDRTAQLDDTLSEWKFDRELRSLIEHMPIRLSKLDQTLSYVFVNDEFSRMTGLPKADAVGIHASEALGPQGWSQVEARMQEALAGHTRKVELDFMLPNGTHFQGLAIYVPARDHRGGIDGIYAIVQDLTELKQRELATLNALQEAERANKEKSSFFAAMNHDLRTPLNAILGFSELITLQAFGPIENPKYIEYAHDIQGSAKILLDLINTAIDFNQIESGSLKLKKTWLDIDEVLDGVCRVLEPSANARNTELKIYTDVGSAIYGDPLALQKVLFNIVGNAIKFTDDGTVTVATVLVDDSLLISVEDTGIGMTERQLQTCCNPYKTSADPTTTNDGGWGLGLAIVQTLVNQHNGRLSIESTRGGGTKVSVLIPLEVST